MVDPRIETKFPDTGYLVKEALAKAEKWWAEWRGAINREFNKRRDEKVRTGVGVPMLKSITEGDDVPSGILAAKPWDELNKVEQAFIVKTWHHFHVREVQAEVNAKIKQVFTITCDNPKHPEEIPRQATFEAIQQQHCYQQARTEGWKIAPHWDLCPFCHQAALLALADSAGSA